MSKYFKKKTSTKDVPEGFCEETVKRIARIEGRYSVQGVMFLKNGMTEMYTVPETMAQSLSKELPILKAAVCRAVTEIDIQNELVAFRIETKTLEILVATADDTAAVVVHKLKKRKRGSN